MTDHKCPAGDLCTGQAFPGHAAHEPSPNYADLAESSRIADEAEVLSVESLPNPDEIAVVTKATEVMYALEEAADEHENQAEHLLDLADASANDTPSFSSVSVVDGQLTVGSVTQVKGVQGFDHGTGNSRFRLLADRHTINAAAYRREARRIRRLLVEEN